MIVILEYNKIHCPCPIIEQYDKFDTEYQMSACLEKFEVSKSTAASL